MEMDVVIFRRRGAAAKLQLGAVVPFEGNSAKLVLHPLCAWTLDSCFAKSDTLELLLDEEEPPIQLPPPGGDAGVVIAAVLDDVGYGSRVVGGGIGPSNPHGEESEDLFYLDRNAIPEGVEVVLRPELEVFW
ncbi:hypothetical protein JKP88DRAFT_325611 [Tribonema minus]|uniref:Uncharacterized protein n=1 Tax=Tribonema minus TaxID=303371 RepID=A0A835YYY0_9STRA|nr:hypothetical protein JKP88DRAFT_325611 [Tribonema minus]